MTFISMYALGVNYAPAIAIRLDSIYSLTSLLPSVLIIIFIYVMSFVGVVVRSHYTEDELWV